MHAAPAANGGFMQVGGVNFAYDPERAAQEVDSDGRVVAPGERVREVILHDGTVLVEDGEVVDGDPITVATIDFSARGGDMYPFRGADFTVVGATYQGALEQYLTGSLEGRVTAERYPEGGSGRIVVGDQATPVETPTGTLELRRTPVREPATAIFRYSTDSPGRDNHVAVFAEGVSPGAEEPLATRRARREWGHVPVSTRVLGAGTFTAYLLDGDGGVLAGPLTFEVEER